MMAHKAKRPTEPKYRGFELPLNRGEALIMHIDMNSCFATIEQQANPLLRGRPIAVSPYTTPRGITIAPSIEAKRLGVKLGMRNEEVRRLAPSVVILPPDPPKYRDAHIRFKHIFTSYTDKVTPKSIDEAIIDFEGSRAIEHTDLVEIGRDIKQRVKSELGEWVKVNVGISTNRFLAKVAAGLNKPDGLDMITHENVLDIYRQLELTDLPGINVRNEARLNINGIFTPLQFLNAPLPVLKKQVFESVNGYYWYLRLRGWEIDDVDFGRKSFGHTYALGKKTNDKRQLARLLMKLCVKTGRRLRGGGFYAEGVHVSMMFRGGRHWHKGKRTKSRLYSDQDIFRHAMRVLNMCPDIQIVTNLAVSVFRLQTYKPAQASIFDGTRQDPHALADAVDTVNDRYGQFVITPALMAGMDDTIIDRIAFGGHVKDLEDLYQERP